MKPNNPTNKHEAPLPRAKLFATFVLLLSATHLATAATVSFFPASSYSTDTATMDQTLGVYGFEIEDFEDTTFIIGLNIAYSGNGFNTTRSALDRVLEFPGGWDGIAITTNDPNNNPPEVGTFPTRTTFNYGPGARSIGIGLGGFQSLSTPPEDFPVTDHRLYINGIALPGTIESLAGATWTPSRSDRNAYLRIDAAVGETITSVGFENIEEGIFGDSDVLLFDHVAVESVPEPSSCILVGAGLLVAFSRRFRKSNRTCA